MLYNTELQSNNDDLQDILDMINSLPEASSGVELPELSNPAEVEEVFLGVEYIDETGDKKIGTFTLDAELSQQDSLITQIQTALDGKAAGGSGGASVETCSVTITSADSDKITNYMTTVFQNGELDNVFHMNSWSRPSTPIVIPNVVCGTTVYVSGAYSLADFTVANCEYTKQTSVSGTFKITAGSGENVTIHCYNGD